MAGFSFGGGAGTTTAAAPGGGFSFGGAAKTTATTLLSAPAATTAGAGGFNFGLNKPAATGGGGLFGSTTATTSSGGFSLGGTPATAAATGFSLGGAAASTASSGFSLGGAATTSTAGSSGFSFGKPATSTAAPGFGGTGLLGNTPASTAGGLGGLGGGLGGGGLFGSTAAAGGTTAAGATGGSIFASTPAAASNTGLGGVDPATQTFKLGSGDIGGSASEGKTLRETYLEPQLVQTVNFLQDFIKKERSVREDVSRMSSAPLAKVAEEVTTLRQLVNVVGSGLQRNAAQVDTLKQDMTQQLKNAEMAQRTKDIPPGLQYENTAPTGFFQALVEDCETRMASYRQQIEALDSHLASQGSTGHTPEELVGLLQKQHEAFVALAAQLQIVHEAVKTQKEHYLSYRRVFHGDTKNIFSKPPTPVKKSRHELENLNNLLSDTSGDILPTGRKIRQPWADVAGLSGPSPFPPTPTPRAMQLVQTMQQQPQGPPVTGLGAGSTMGSFGSFGGNTGGFGSFGASTKPTFGSSSSSLGGVGSLFSSTVPGGLAGAAGGLSAPTLGSSTTAALNLAGTQPNMAALAQPKQPFQLQKPPAGGQNKRGKRF